jgi:hypothetical protein
MLITTLGAAEVSAPIVFATPEPDVYYQAVMTPAWNATTWRSGITENGYTINVSAAPGGAGGDVRWVIVR